MGYGKMPALLCFLCREREREREKETETETAHNFGSPKETDNSRGKDISHCNVSLLQKVRSEEHSNTGNKEWPLTKNHWLQHTACVDLDRRPGWSYPDAL